MDSEDLTVKNFLDELYRLTGGDPEQQVSMYDVGASIGLDRTEGKNLAEHLMVQGLVDLKTLAGGIGITAEGMTSLGYSAAASAGGNDEVRLEMARIASDADRQVVQLLTDEIKAQISGGQIDYTLLEEIIIDLKTIEVQLLSPQPKSKILAEVFCSLQTALATAQMDELSAKLATAVNCPA
ncbi:MAG: hypothetical protein ACWGOX_15775 [Desulforhopalus sp.]